jgi:pimeloyl-ACP methyl ester carboxylesterase
LALKERVVRFGDSQSLVGIQTSPAAQVDASRPAILLLNAGIIHRIGAHRLNVKLARFFAGEGYTALRFDLSGIGDSPPSRSGAGFEMQAVHDIRAAMDFLQAETGAREFVAVGICSGADNAYAAAAHDERLRGLVMLDPYAYETPQAKIRFHFARSLQLRRWRRAGMRRLRLLRDRLFPSLASNTPPRKRIIANYVRTPPPLEEYGGNLARLVQRGVRIYMCYSRGMFALINASGQFFSTFRAYSLEKNVRVETLPEVDHTYTEIREQAALAKRVLAWIQSEIRPGTPGIAQER